MDSKFVPPKDEKEFQERSAKVTAQAAQQMIKALRHRREAAIKPIDDEIRYYKKILDIRTQVLPGQTSLIGEEE